MEDWICILHGALILTNDGDMVYHVTHPKYEKTKTYVATLSGIITDEKIKNLKDGVVIGDYKTKEAKVRILKIDKEKKTSRIEVTIHEGKNKQVRKMCEAVGYPVMANKSFTSLNFTCIILIVRLHMKNNKEAKEHTKINNEK